MPWVNKCFRAVRRAWVDGRLGHFFHLGDDCYIAYADRGSIWQTIGGPQIPTLTVVVFPCKKYSGCWVATSVPCQSNNNESHAALHLWFTTRGQPLPADAEEAIRQYFAANVTALSLDDYLHGMGF